MDHYEILEVSHKASQEVIEAAYRTLVKSAGDVGRKKYALNAAKDILFDPIEREKYDKTLGKKKPGKQFGNYRILEMIAEGGFGKTYKAVQETLDTLVCIKHAHQISAQDEEILLDEARAIWDLRHFSIPCMRDILKMEDDSLALVMSYVPGPTIEQIVEKHGAIDAEHVAWICERALNALKYLHYHGVVHGDVKPQNIIVQPDTHTVVIVDYGLSLIRSKNKSSKGYTPFFAAPEQIKGDVGLLPESDFYGLGMTMIHALGGDVAGKKVPDSTPEPLCDFLKSFIKHSALERPNWNKVDLCESIHHVREKSFGRRYSSLKPLKY